MLMPMTPARQATFTRVYIKNMYFTILGVGPLFLDEDELVGNDRPPKTTGNGKFAASPADITRIAIINAMTETIKSSGKLNHTHTFHNILRLGFQSSFGVA